MTARPEGPSYEDPAGDRAHEGPAGTHLLGPAGLEEETELCWGLTTYVWSMSLLGPRFG